MYILPIDILCSLSLSSINSLHNVWCQHFQTTKAACHSPQPQLVRREPAPLPCPLAPEMACLHHLQDVSEIVQKLQGGSRQREQCSTHSHIWNTGGNRECLTYAFDRIQCTDTDLSSHLQFGILSCWSFITCILLFVQLSLFYLFLLLSRTVLSHPFQPCLPLLAFPF